MHLFLGLEFSKNTYQIYLFLIGCIFLLYLTFDKKNMKFLLQVQPDHNPPPTQFNICDYFMQRPHNAINAALVNYQYSSLCNLGPTLKVI